MTEILNGSWEIVGSGVSQLKEIDIKAIENMALAYDNFKKGTKPLKSTGISRDIVKALITRIRKL